MVAEFIAFLNHLSHSFSTIRSYLSAISFFHKLEEFPDPMSTFLVARVLKGVSKDNNTRNRLLPISRSLLHSILDKLVFLSSSPSEYYLSRCLFLLAYYCCLRAGEAVVSTHSQHTLQLLSLSQFSDSSHSTSTIRFSSFKHSREQITFVLEGTSTNSEALLLAQFFFIPPAYLFRVKTFVPAFTSACPGSI